MDPLRIEHERCKGCGLCVEFCAAHVLRLADSINALGYHPVELIDPEACTACALCAEMCPETGIEVYRKVRRKPQPPAQESKA